MPHEKFMTEAINLAKNSILSGGGPFASIIVKNNQIVGKGNNQVTKTNDPTAHGEIVAIRDACKNLNTFQLENCILYTNAEPCPMCFGAIYWARPQAVFFASTKEDAAKINFDDNFIYQEIQTKPESRKIPFHQIMQLEAWEVFKSWQEYENKTPY